MLYVVVLCSFCVLKGKEEGVEGERSPRSSSSAAAATPPTTETQITEGSGRKKGRRKGIELVEVGKRERGVG